MPRLALAAAIVVSLFLAAAVALAAPSGTTLRISADATSLRFDRRALHAEPGLVTITMKNPSFMPHNVAIRGKGVRKLGKVVLKGGTSTVSVRLKRGTYVFFCSVVGHEQGGMRGVLTVG